MENGSKALLMAGGILMAIIIATGLIIMWTNMSKTQAQLSGNEKDEQLAEFNEAFVTYANETVMGTDIISLFNRVNSYDQNVDNDILLSKIQYEKIAIYVNVNDIKDDTEKLKDFQDVLGLKTTADGTNIMSTGSETYKQLKRYIELEKKYGRETLSKLSTYYNSVDQSTDPFSKYTETNNRVDHPVVKQVLQEKGWNDSKMNGSDSQKEELREAVMKKILGKSTPISKDLKTVSPIDGKTGNDIIAEYSVYTAFKTTKFTCTDIQYSQNNGQVSSMTFKAK